MCYWHKREIGVCFMIFLFQKALTTMALHPTLHVQAVLRSVGIRDECGDMSSTHAQCQQGRCKHSCKSVPGATALKVYLCHAQQKSSLSNSCCTSPHGESPQQIAQHICSCMSTVPAHLSYSVQEVHILICRIKLFCPREKRSV